MPGLVVNGKQIEVPGLTIRNWFDDPKFRLRIGDPNGGNDGRRRKTNWVRLIVLHTTGGYPDAKHPAPQRVITGPAPDDEQDLRHADIWRSDPTASGAHLVIDTDGSVVCLADLLLEAAYHATTVNDVSIGIEIYQRPDSAIYDASLRAAVTLVDALTAQFGIQRQMQGRYRGDLLRLEAGGRDVVGVVGHRDVTDNRGFGDPGDLIFQYLATAGYEAVDFGADRDLALWTERQQELVARGAAIKVDGVAGPETRDALAKLGYRHGLWLLPPPARIRTSKRRLLSTASKYVAHA